jgi:high-affinity nickel-transport protein
MANKQSGGAICGCFIVFGGLSVLIYKPWRRHIDKKRMRNAQFLPIPQGTGSDIEASVPEQSNEIQRDTPKGADDGGVVEISIEVTDAAGPATAVSKKV